MNTWDDPETQGLTEGELFGYAAMEAMKDAGVTPKDVDYYFHGQANPMGCDYITPNIMAANWVGMKGKGSIHHTDVENEALWNLNEDKRGPCGFL